MLSFDTLNLPSADLANLARMPSGGLQDDLSVIVVRINGDIIVE